MQALQTLTNELKSRAKKLFKTAFNVNKLVVTVKDIKALFPAFDGRKVTHWFNLIDKCETKLQELEQVEKAAKVSTMSLNEFNQYCHELVLDACKKYDCHLASDVNWLSYSVKLAAKDVQNVSRVIGTLYINRQGVASISWSKAMYPKVCSNINQGFQILLSMFRKPAIAA